MSEELKPCPFCGGEADVHYFAHDDSECTVMCSNPNCRASVSARSCGSMTTAYNRARKLWNRRDDSACEQRRTRRTCRYVRDHMGVAGNWFCKCSECGAEFDERVVDSHFVYCPECGARVIEEGSDEGF